MTPPIRATTTTAAPPEEVWKLLHDPARFGAWWHGVEDAEPNGDGRVLFHREDGAVMPSLVSTDAGERHVVVSCLELDVRYEWLLDALDHGGTSITARCTLSEREVARWHVYRAAVTLSLRRLAELAESATAAPRARG
jgi:uncharacterized protein YndB with AHSA1/START domain